MAKRHSAEEVVNKLRQVDVELSKGGTIVGACKLIGISEQTYHRWRKEYRGIYPQSAIRRPGTRDLTTPSPANPVVNR
jgi:transposase-like protein